MHAMYRRYVFVLAVAVALAATAASPIAFPAQAASTGIVVLTQVGCQFLEPENSINHRFAPKAPADCEAINARTGDARLARTRPMRLREGDYIFRVTNLNVPYELGFWIRDRDYEDAGLLARLTMTSVSGGGLTSGRMKDYRVTLKPGRYLFSCPLNPTPDYELDVVGR